LKSCRRHMTTLTAVICALQQISTTTGSGWPGRLDTRTTFAIEDFAVELLEVMDNFERAEKADGASLREGMEQIRKLFTTILDRHGIRPIECRNLPFDPERQEAGCLRSFGCRGRYRDRRGHSRILYAG